MKLHTHYTCTVVHSVDTDTFLVLIYWSMVISLHLINRKCFCVHKHNFLILFNIYVRRPLCLYFIDHLTCPKRFHLPPPLDGTEQVDQFKCLGVIFQHSLSFESHVVSLLKQCSQRIYLPKMLRSQSIPTAKLHIIFREPPIKSMDYVLRNSGQSYILPHCNYQFHKNSFINWCLFS